MNKSLANAVVLNSKESYWVQSPVVHDLKTFSNELIKTISVIKTTLKCNDRAATNFTHTVVEEGQIPVFGQDLFPQIGL